MHLFAVYYAIAYGDAHKKQFDTSCIIEMFLTNFLTRKNKIDACAVGIRL